MHAAEFEFPHPSNERLNRALVFSLALHLILLTFWAPRQHVILDHGASTLNAVLSTPSMAPEQKPEPFSLALQPEKPSAASVITAPSRALLPRAVEVREPAAQVNPADQKAASTASGSQEERQRRLGEARAAMEINDDGSVGQIIWYQLPALTDEQLFRLEAAIRKRYQMQSQSGNFVRETLDIRDFLGKDVIH